MSAEMRIYGRTVFFCCCEISLLRSDDGRGKLNAILLDDRMMRSESGVNADCSDLDLLPLIPFVAIFENTDMDIDSQ